MACSTFHFMIEDLVHDKRSGSMGHGSAAGAFAEVAVGVAAYAAALYT